MRLLLIAPDQLQAHSLGQELRRLQHSVRVQSAFEFNAPLTPHLLVLAIDSCDEILCKRVNAWRASCLAIAILVLLDSGDYRDRVALLNAGADDVLSTPYAGEEFIARVQALLRRIDPEAGFKPPEPERLTCGDLVINHQTRSVTRGVLPIKLTVKEYDLLLYLVKHKGVVQPRLDILKAVWGETWVGDDNLLDVYIRYLRRKLEQAGCEPLIRTVRGVGFVVE